MQRLALVGVCLFLATAAPVAGGGSARAQQASGAGGQPAPQVHLGTKPRELLLTKITVSDLARSYEFYTKVIGLKLAVSPEFPALARPNLADADPKFIEVPLNFSGSMAEPMLLLVKQRGSKPTPETARLTWISFKVDDKREVVRRAVAAGHAPFRGGEAEGQATFVADPDGYTVELFDVPSFPMK